MAGGSFADRLVDWLRERAKRDRNRLSVTIVPTEGTRVLQLELPRWAIRVAVTLLIVGTVLLVAAVVSNGVLWIERTRLRGVEEENRLLRQSVGRVEQLEDEFRQLDQFRRQLYALAGVPDVSPTEAESSSVSGARLEGRPGPSDQGILVLTDEAWATPLRVAPARGPVSRGFSMGISKIPEHTGVDIAGSAGAPVLAAATGVVVSAGWDSTFGNMLAIRHRDGWETRYGHNEELLAIAGDSVWAGQQIARLGSTGRSSAPHLHFETIHDGVVVDPAAYFRVYQTGGIEGNR
jgi:murein DD-endopeptidase MepM/ murein hydrolase activator NlpD